MKKLLGLLCTGMLLVCAAGCGNPGDSQSPESSEGPGASADGGSAMTDHNYEEGWTEEMGTVKAAVVDSLGEDYWPNMALLPDMLEEMVGISSDMYEDYFAEIPMISVNVDTLIVVKAVESKADAVEDALLAYYDKNVSNTMQYPQNVGKIQAARVERIGNYVIFAQLGADTSEVSEEGDQEVIISHCQEINDQVIEIISNTIQH